MSGTLFLGLICTLGGLWLMLTAFRRRAGRLALLRNCVRVKGQVIRHEDITTEGDIRDTHAPVVSYKAEDGQSYEIALLPRHDRDAYRVGAKVPILYERGNPRNAAHVARMWDVNLFCALSFVPVLLGAGIISTDYQDSAEHREPPAGHSP